jgi:hypothetical protein
MDAMLRFATHAVDAGPHGIARLMNLPNVQRVC